MNIEQQKLTLIKKIESIEDADLLNTVKSMIDYGLKQNSSIKNSIEIPEWHKELVQERRKNAKPENYLEWDALETLLDKKYGIKCEIYFISIRQSNSGH